jgi:hypothetical protein
MTNEQPRLTIDKRSPALWVVTFANPRINLIDAAIENHDFSAYGNIAIGNEVYHCPRSFYMVRMRLSSGDGKNDTGTPADRITSGRAAGLRNKIPG